MKEQLIKRELPHPTFLRSSTQAEADRLNEDRPLDYYCTDIYRIEAEIYQSDNYSNLAEARSDGASYKFAIDASAPGLGDALYAICVVAECLQHEAARHNLRGRLVVNDRYEFSEVPLGLFEDCLASLVKVRPCL